MERSLPYFTTPDNCNLFYTTDNFNSDRPAIVLLNGTSQTTIYWEPHAIALANRFRVLRYDARAQGKSDIGRHPISAQTHISDLKKLFDHLNLPKAHLVGISHGAYIALRLAGDTPKMVDRLVLGSIGNDAQAYIKQVVQAWSRILERSDLETMAWAVVPLVFGRHFLNQHREIIEKIVAAIALRNNKAALMAHFKAISNYPPVEKFATSLHCPALVISGSDDPIVSCQDARQLAEKCHGRYEMFPETGHSIPAESPALFQETVLNFLNQP